MAKKKSWSTTEDETQDDGRPSKSQVKREHLEYQHLASRLLELSLVQLKTFPLSDDLFETLRQGKLIDSHIALRRHLRLLGKLISMEDAAQIQTALDKLHQPHRDSTTRFHLIETWRERLLSNDPNSLDECLVQFPTADRQTLLDLIQQTKMELVDGKKAEYRKLFRYLDTLPK